MKVNTFIFILFLFLSSAVFAQSDGDFRSNQSGNWDDVDTWQRYDGTSSSWQDAGVGNNNPGQIPSNSSDVWEIQSAHTVTVNIDAECKNIKVNGTLSGDANSLSVYGDLTNNGTLDLYTSSGTALIFAGTGNATFSGTGTTTDIHTIEIAKDVLASTVQLQPSNFTVHGVSVNAPKFLTITTGTFRISGSFTMNSDVFIGSANIVLQTDEGFWLDNSNFTVDGQDDEFEYFATLRISAGTFNVGDTSPNRLNGEDAAANFTLEGGTVNITGAFYASNDDAITYTQTGGTLNVATMQVTNAGWYCFNLSDNDVNFTMSAGTINIIQANTAGREYWLNSDVGNTNITGGTLNIGTSATAGDFIFEINGRMPNVVIDNTTNTKTAIVRDQTWIYGNLIVNGTYRYRDASYNQNLYVYGDMTISSTGTFQVFQSPTNNRTQNLYLEGNLVVDGELDGFFDTGTYEARLYTYFQGTSNATVTGTGANCEFYDIMVNKGADMTAELDIQRAFTMPAATGSGSGDRLNVSNGTLKISGSGTVNITPYWGDTYLTSATGRFWLTNSNVSITGDNNARIISNGEFILDNGSISCNEFWISETSTANNQINGGTISIDATGNDAFDIEQDLLFSGGTINCDGRFYVDEEPNATEFGDFLMTGGILNVNYVLVSGTFELDAGTVNVGDGNDVFNIQYGGTLQIDGGTLNLYGRFDTQNDAAPDNNKFTMTGGNFNIDPQHTSNLGNNDVFQIQYNVDVNFTGGTLTFIDPAINQTAWTSADFEILNNTTPGPGVRNFSGSTIVFGDGGSTAGVANHDFVIRCYQLPVDLGNIVINNPNAVANNRVVRVYDQNITIENLTITNGVFEFNGRGGTRGKEIKIYNDVVNNGEINATDDDCHLIFNGSDAQTYSGSGVFTDYLSELTFNNTSVTGVTLSNDLGATTINFTDGNVYTDVSGSGLLTVYGNAATNLVGGSATNYVQGPLRRAIPSGLSASTYVFPIASVGASATYRQFQFNLTTGGSGDGFVTINSTEPANPANPNTIAAAGTGLKSPLTTDDIYWKMISDLSSVTIDNASTITLNYDASGGTLPKCVAQSNDDQDGPYNSIGRNLGGTTTIASTAFDNTSYLASNDITYFVIADVQPLQGEYTVGNSGDFLNLTEVADTLRKNYVMGYVVFEMLGNYDDATEVFPVDFNSLLKVNSTDGVVIRPDAGVSNTVTADNGSSGADIRINGISNLRFDGRPGGTGTSGDWTFQHDDGTVFTFENDATHDTLSYLIIKSDFQSNTNGVVNFGTSSGSTGNDDNVIDNCDITGISSTPTIAIFSAGTAGAINSGNKISNCNIYDFFNPTEDSKGIFLSDNNSEWTIENNKLYQTTTKIFTQDQVYSGIYINSGINYTIDGNIIGYEASDGTGITDIDGSTNTTLSQFAGIWLNLDNGTASTVENNIITAINFTTSFNAGDNCGVFSGIYVEDGDVNIGSSGNGNIIGSISVNDDIEIEHESGGYSYAIKSNSNDEVNISYNNMGGITVTGINNDDNLFFRGIFTRYGDDYTITNNIIGSSSSANSIQTGISGSTTGQTDIFGIYNYENTSVNISNNTIANLTVYGDNINSRLNGIYVRDGSNTINNNDIYNLTSYSRRQSWAGDPCVVGIRRYSSRNSQQIIGNEIYGLIINRDDGTPIGSGASDSRNSNVIGIFYYSCQTEADNISRNFIHNFSAYSNNEDAIFTGIYIYGADRIDFPDIISNNMIQLGINETGNSVLQPLRMYGINYYIDAPVDFYHNSIYIGGSNVYTNGDNDASGDTPDSTFCIFKRATALSTIKNNIFENVRSNADAASVGAHYAMWLSYEDVVNSDYNIYNVTGTGGLLANFDGNDLLDMRSIRAYADNGNDLHSGFGSPNYQNPDGDISDCNLHLTGITPAEGMGVAIGSITVDLDNQNRAGFSQVDIGADAGNFYFDASVDIYTPFFNYTPIDPQACGVTSAVIDVTITDQGSGLPTSGVLQPRVYYRDNSGNWSAGSNSPGVLQSGNGNLGVWRFTLTGLLDNNYYEYYIVAQDQSTYLGTPNIGYSKFDDDSPVHTDVNNVTNYPDSDVAIDVFTVCVNPAASYRVGNSTDCPTCDFETLTAYQDFFFNMNAMTIDKDVTCYIVENTYEPATYAAEHTTESGVGNWKIKIVPEDDSKVRVIKADNTINYNLIRFEGGDRYTIDGQFNDDGNRWLTFSHDKNDQSVFCFVDDAQTDTLEYLTIIGAGTLNPRGTIFFDSSTVASPLGNNNIVIDHNKITANAVNKVPLNAIYSNAGEDANNSNNIVSNNEIANFQKVGIWLIDNNDAWTISNNTMYSTFVSDTLEAVISINSGSGYTINNNSIGGSDINLAGNPMENDEDVEFNAIYLNVDDDVVSNITNNTIKNIEMSINGWGNYVYGIRVEAGWANITGNTIENFTNNRDNYTYGIALSGASNISISNNIITNITTNGNGDLRTIYINTDPDNINNVQNNIISNINMTNSGNGIDFYAIYNDEGNSSITGNTIGGTNAGDKINFAGGNDFIGIYINDDNVANQDITNNNILNIEVTDCRDFFGIYPANMVDVGQIGINNNTIDNLDITASRNMACIYALDGELDVDNNTIGTSSYGIINSGLAELRGIWLSPNEQNAIIQNNTLANFNSTTANISAIYYDDSRNYSITNNTISGHTVTNEITFTAIRINGGNDGSIQGNTIENIIMNNAGTNTVFNGIWVSRGDNNIGTTTANTIGHTSTANSISINGGTARGLYFTNTANIINAQNNLIANISSSGNSASVNGIVVNNTGGTVNIDANTIRDLTASGTSDSYVIGISFDNAGNKSISANTIYDLTTASQKINIANGILASQGVFVAGTSTGVITGNTIYNISASGTANTNVAGISENATNARILKNKIYDISNTSSGAGTASGIVLFNLAGGYVANNYISIGENDDTEYSGIYIPQTGTGTKQVYYNSIYIGDVSTGGNSYGFLRAGSGNTTPLYLRNNIFSNFRTGGTANYSVANVNTGDWSSNSYMKANCYYADEDAAKTGLWGAVDNDFNTWLTNTGESDEYLSTQDKPLFVDAPNCDLHISDLNNSCGFNSVGEPFADVTDDYDGNARDANHPDIGADEIAPTGRSGKFVWRGWSDTDWSNAGNWQCGIAPANTPGELIVIPEATLNPIINKSLPASTVIADALQIRNNGILTIYPGNSLTLNGNFELNGEIILETPASASEAIGSFIDNGTITGSGQMTIKRFITGHQYHEFSPAVANVSSTIFTETNPSGNYNYNLYWYDETVDLDAWSGAGSGSTNPTGAGAYEPDSLGAGWKFVQTTPGAGVTLDKTEGYMFYTDINQTIIMQGTPNTGNCDATGLTWTNNDPRTDSNGDDVPELYDGWNFIGNPYPSSIDVDLLTFSAEIDPGVYVWNNTGYSGWKNGSSVMAAGITNGIIAPMQGFFVIANADGGNVQINNADRTHDAPIFLKSGNNKKFDHSNYLKLKTTANGKEDFMVVQFLSDATNEYDGKYDLVRLFTNSSWGDHSLPQSYSLSEANRDQLALNVLPLSEMFGKVVPVGFTIGNAGNYSISVEEFNDFDNIHVYFIDSVDNNIINLRNTNSYVFDFDGGKVNDRFYLNFAENQSPIVDKQIDNQNAYEDEEFVFTFDENTFIDPDFGDDLVYQAILANNKQLPNWLVFDSDSRTFSGTPLNENVGQLNLKIVAFDIFNNSDTLLFTLEINNTNDAPTLNRHIDDQFATENTLFTFSFPENTFNDIDYGDVLDYTVNPVLGLPQWLSFNKDTRTFSGTPIDSDIGIVPITIVATDLAGESVVDEFDIIVKNLSTNIELSEAGISIYPNPSNGLFSIGFENYIKSTDLIIYNSLGQKVFYTELDSDINDIDISFLAAGSYTLEIRTGTNVYFKKIIRE